MTTDVRLGKRKPFTSRTALAYLAALIGLAATFSLPVVMVLAEAELEEQKTRMGTKDKEITRLKSEVRKAAEREQELRVQYNLGMARNTGIDSTGQQVTVMRVPPADLPNRPASVDDQQDSTSHKGDETGLADYDAKVSLLYDKVMGDSSPSPGGQSEDFHSRLTRLHEKVVQQHADQ